jgi:hypothetical protein
VLDRRVVKQSNVRGTRCKTLRDEKRNNSSAITSTELESQKETIKSVRKCIYPSSFDKWTGKCQARAAPRSATAAMNPVCMFIPPTALLDVVGVVEVDVDVSDGLLVTPEGLVAILMKKN